MKELIHFEFVQSGFLLADAGYDVWLANSRGTRPSRGHVRLSSTGLRQKDYWSFSWHEIGVYDLPAMIDYILDKTNHKQLNYIGYSQGTTAFIVMASMRPEYNAKILESHLMAPVSSLKQQYNPFFSVLARYYVPFKRIFAALRIYKMDMEKGSPMMFDFCSKYKSFFPCKFIDSIAGSNSLNCVSISNM